MIKRRDFLITTAAAILAASIPTHKKYDLNFPRNVNWEEVMNRVISDRNALIVGMLKPHRPYEIGSPEWCMEEALADHHLLGEGEAVHV